MIKKNLNQKKNFFSKKVYSNQPEKQYKKILKNAIWNEIKRKGLNINNWKVNECTRKDIIIQELF